MTQVLNAFSKLMTRLFGSRNERLVRSYHRRVEQINSHESEIRRLTDNQLRAKTEVFRERCAAGEPIERLVPEATAVAREVMDRAVGIRNILDPQYEFDPSALPASARAMYQRLREEAEAREPEVVQGGEPAPGWMQVEIPLELYDAVRNLYPESRPPFRARPFDVQLIGGMVLSEGRIAEMKTGEGKTIVAPLACYLACLEGLHCSVVTVNDYLVQRDRDWVFPFYYWLGLTVGAIHPQHMQPPEKKAEAYGCNVRYGTNSEFGFDYLRDNMKLSVREQVQKHRDFCIIDEVDSILIDEARTPLIISGPAREDAPRYGLADQLARHLIQKQRPWDAADRKVQDAIMKMRGLEGDIRNTRDKDSIPEMRRQMEELKEQTIPHLEAERDQHTQYYEVERDKKAAHLTHEGVAEAQKVAGIGSFYHGNNIDMPHLLENALRAHVIYQRDKDYVVQNGEVIIVDENTGRLMIGRQWSDGLHQAVEAKEKVKIKQETQTLATVTIQNYFKLYKRLAGMTGTAMTEANEFHEIYKLDVVSIPTNLPVRRSDLNDLIFLSSKDKWTAILEEIKRMHDVGRPVLVGTTSVEYSERLSQMLTKRYGIPHQVLNAKHHEQEAQIIANAGELGAVMIATNMAGRGTDIRLKPVPREKLIEHWKRRNLLPAEANPEMDDQRIINLAYRHQIRTLLGMKPADIKQLSDEECRLRLLRHWVAEHTMAGERTEQMSAEQCEAELDAVPGFLLHRLEMWPSTEAMGGLHIVGTERHESRRVDNQLRGRSGRQGDRGSSRFFISLEDDLMKLFAGKAVLSALSRLGMKEGDAIEHKWITRSVERAQRKVEERNFQIRKNLLEYDEVMEHQRNSFYGIRQQVLEGRDIDRIIFDYIEDAVEDAVDEFLSPDYRANQISEWARSELDVSTDPVRLRAAEDDLESMMIELKEQARADVQSTVETTIGEYMSRDTDPDDWDLRGLAAWAQSRFNVTFTQSKLRKMEPEEVSEQLIQAAQDEIEKKDYSGVARFLEDLYPQSRLAEWANQKFDLQITAEQLDLEEREQIVNFILEQARDAYRKREIHYPVEYVLEMAFSAARQDSKWAAEQLSEWVSRRYDEQWPADDILKLTGNELSEKLIAMAERYHEENRLEQIVDEKLASAESEEALLSWAEEKFGEAPEAEAFKDADAQQRRQMLLDAGRRMHRAELSRLERFILLQILDGAWKDHLYAMDHLKSSVGLSGYAQQDPRIQYKRQGGNLFQQMHAVVRDRVTNLVFKARLTTDTQMRDVYGQQQAVHAEGQKASAYAAAQAQQQEQPEGDLARTERGEPHVSRRQRRAAGVRGGTRTASRGGRPGQRDSGGGRATKRRRR